MAMGIPVVGTTSAVQGVEGMEGRDYLVANEARDFAESVCRLLRDPESAQELGLRGRRFVEQNYDWEVVFRPLDEVLERCVASHASASRRRSPGPLRDLSAELTVFEGQKPKRPRLASEPSRLLDRRLADHWQCGTPPRPLL
jgi:hypothetical protein